MPNIPFPDLPNTDGVTGIPINAGGLLPSAADINLSNIIGAIRSGSILGAYQTLLGIKYGIYKNGLPILDFDTILDITASSSSQIIDYPIENGAFYSFNKIAVPSTYTINALKTDRLIGSSKTDVINTLTSLLRPAKFGFGNQTGTRSGNASGIFASVSDFLGVPTLSDTDVQYVDVVTPEKTYSNVQVESFDVTVNVDDGNILNIKVVMKEIMQPLSSSDMNASQADGATAINNGRLSGQPEGSVSAYTNSKVNSAISSIKGLV